MVRVEEFYNILLEHKIDYFTGVPDSQLKAFCDFIINTLGVGKNHMIAPNEGNAVALAAGYHIATGKIGMVYMQNSGLGNAVNPITSLTDPEVYGIPVMYLIGWRGQPGVKDEPQHVKQGKITLELLELLNIKYFIIKKTTEIADITNALNNEFKEVLAKGQSVAFVVEKDSLEACGKMKNENFNKLSREAAIKVIVDSIEKDTLVVSTTGKASRELFEYRENTNQSHEKDFLTVGSMGHASMISLAIAENSNKKVVCIDGDGAMIMHTGAAALIGSRKPRNFVHILINNGAHETVGGMPTISYDIDWGNSVKAFGYKTVYKAFNEQEIEEAVKKAQNEEGPVLIEIIVNTESRKELTRPSIKPIDNKKNIMTFIQE
ncbi:phosphonopyruvate decarboxylase [Lachnotalea glycerini]|uniref:Phosphonopyruvate decarboxylase n=1 Tax=Lachnotalea glycerini TaxID=1763509 RepID=A0A371J6H7_9FIRM|nr:phosphonopyruvate decarboxylase [Lachnotalea glycerini]RDY28276.1 phosphonopyruvate decarboxylase [Lachnotalea glycerini]